MMQMYEKAYVDKLVDVYEAAKEMVDSEYLVMDSRLLNKALDAIERGENE